MIVLLFNYELTLSIAQADMYQMYAYSKKYQTPYAWLIYPLNEDIKDIADTIDFLAKENENPYVNIKVFFVNLSDYRNSIEKLYMEIYQQKESLTRIL